MDTRKGNVLSPFQFGTHTFKIILIAALLSLCMLVMNQIKHSHYFPIKKVRVYGVSHLSNAEVQRTLIPLVNRNYFNINVKNIRDQILQLPWVSDLNVRRVWPDEVEITIFEKIALAYWNNLYLVSEKGEIFAPNESSYPSNLPKFVGPNGVQMEMIKYFLEINRILIPLHAKISCLEMTPYATWKLILDNGIMVQVGNKDIFLRLNQFVKVYPKIVKNHLGMGVASVDLRYPNGMAVRWKKPIKV